MYFNTCFSGKEAEKSVSRQVNRTLLRSQAFGFAGYWWRRTGFRTVRVLKPVPGRPSLLIPSILTVKTVFTSEA